MDQPLASNRVKCKYGLPRLEVPYGTSRLYCRGRATVAVEGSRIQLALPRTHTQCIGNYDMTMTTTGTKTAEQA